MWYGATWAAILEEQDAETTLVAISKLRREIPLQDNPCEFTLTAACSTVTKETTR